MTTIKATLQDAMQVSQHLNASFDAILTQMAFIYRQVLVQKTYVSLTFLHHTELLKRRACFLKRNVFPCILAVLSTSSSKRSPLSKTLSIFSIMTFRTCYNTKLTRLHHYHFSKNKRCMRKSPLL